jgi:hypothetical protein
LKPGQAFKVCWPASSGRKHPGRDISRFTHHKFHSFEGQT